MTFTVERIYKARVKSLICKLLTLHYYSLVSGMLVPATPKSWFFDARIFIEKQKNLFQILLSALYTCHLEKFCRCLWLVRFTYKFNLKKLERFGDLQRYIIWIWCLCLSIAFKIILEALIELNLILFFHNLYYLKIIQKQNFFSKNYKKVI